MIKTLRETKARLSQFVALAETGEDVVITVRGRPRARLTAAARPTEQGRGRKWSAELRSLHRRYGTDTTPRDSREILDLLREDRS
ncbi:MAG: hypothetical protein A3K19_24495 [Lentisphaerae bacterium RIFOXYB12_FULL_65_16]|nr:MAG: hypothetical protein A3K18_18205 [Lentisphaerae bacterium RIFOXYA12_64_32]OGV88543.1 MAG: hypothetical protein A3K19_24495 [Lentisphaerae bacterium RIFOXYB12_FULL_65_16]